MGETLRVTRTSQSRLSESLRENAAFGSVFSDHMLFADFDGGTWSPPQILPYGPLPLPPAPSALHYGQSVFEGFKASRTVDGGLALFRPRDNCARLNRSAARLAMPEVPEALFLEGVAELIRLDREWIPRREGGALYVRPVYFATDETLGVRPSSRYRLVVLTCPVGPYFSAPVDLLAEERYVRAFPGGTGDVKPAGNYAGSLPAARDAQQRGYHNVMWLDALEHRFVEECGVMNVFFVLDARVLTPPLGGTILPGVTRDSALTLLREMGRTVEERRISIDEVFEAHASGRLVEGFGTGTAAAVASIGRIRYREQEIRLPNGRPESVAEQLRSRLEAIRVGREPDRHGWLLRV